MISTKYRQAWIAPEIEPAWFPYLATVARNAGSPSLAINGTADHLHVLVSLGRTTSIAELVETLKTISSKWIKTKGDADRDFHWQTGYGTFSIGQSGLDDLKRYIADQKAHHHRQSFQDELRELLRLYDVPYDKRYVWD